MEQHWNCELVARENVTPNTIKNTVYDFFEKETVFKKEWMEKNKKDLELYDLVSQQPMLSLGTREYINKFYEKL